MLYPDGPLPIKATRKSASCFFPCSSPLFAASRDTRVARDTRRDGRQNPLVVTRPSDSTHSKFLGTYVRPKPRQGAPRDTTKLGDLTRHNCNTSCYVVGELIAVGQSGGRRSVRGAERERQKSPTDTGSGPSQTPGRKWAFAQTNTRPGGPSGRKGGGHAHLLLKTCLVLEHFHRLLSNFPIFNMI